MSIKAFLVPAVLGFTGTTTIALPSAWAYGKGKANSITYDMEKKIKELKESNGALKQDNEKLKQTEQQEREVAEKIRKQSEEKQKEIDSITETNKVSQQNYNTAWQRHDALLKEHEKFKAERDQAVSEKPTLKHRMEQLKTELNKQKTQTNIEGSKAGIPRKVSDHIQKEIEGLEQEGNKNRVYSYLKDRIGDDGGKLKDIAKRPWKCKKIAWPKDAAQEGIAYCVVSEGNSGVTYTSAIDGDPWKIPQNLRH